MENQAMTPDDLKAWQKAMGYKNMGQSADALGLSVDTLKAYSSGRNRIPRTVALACSALVHRMKPWNAMMSEFPPNADPSVGSGQIDGRVFITVQALVGQPVAAMSIQAAKAFRDHLSDTIRAVE